MSAGGDAEQNRRPKERPTSMKPKRRSEMRDKSSDGKERSEQRDRERSNRDRERREKRSDKDRSQKDRDKERSGRDKTGDDDKRRTRSKSKDKRDKDRPDRDRERNHDRQKSKSERSQDASLNHTGQFTPTVPQQQIPSSPLADQFDAMMADLSEMNFDNNSQTTGVLDQKSIRPNFSFPDLPQDPKSPFQNFPDLPPDPRNPQKPNQEIPLDSRSPQKYPQDPRTVQPYSPDIRAPQQYSQDPRVPYSPDTRSPQQHTQDPRALQPYSQDSRAAQQYSQDPRAPQSYSQDSRAPQHYSPDPRSPQQYPLDPRTQKQYPQDHRDPQSYGQDPRFQNSAYSPYQPLDQPNKNYNSSPSNTAENPPKRKEGASPQKPSYPERQTSRNPNAVETPLPIERLNSRNERNNFGPSGPFPNDPAIERQNSRNNNYNPKDSPIERQNSRNNPNAGEPPIERQNSRNNPIANEAPIERQNSRNNPVANEAPIERQNSRNNVEPGFERQNSRNNIQQQPDSQDYRFDDKKLRNIPIQNDPLPFVEVCGGCNKEITEEEEEDCFEIDALNKLYHVDCFRCFVCQIVFSDDNPYIPHNGKAYCETHYEEFVHQPVCAGCNEPIFGQPLTALGKPWHPEHLVCASCNKPIQGNVFEHKGAVYCAADYTRLVAPTCRACRKPVQGETICAMGNTYHRACFVCTKCRKNFENKSFYVYDGEPYCKIDYHECNNSLCGECRLPIEGPCAEVADLDKRYHPDCWICHACHQPLTGTYYSYNQSPYCENDIIRV
ncbi:hypothetical protein HK096_003419, partial [Nowakowskiella sp. JEL0078]